MAQPQTPHIPRTSIVGDGLLQWRAMRNKIRRSRGVRERAASFLCTARKTCYAESNFAERAAMQCAQAAHGEYSGVGLTRRATPSAKGLGRVITRRRGCGRAATGGKRCKVTVSSIFFRFRSGRQRGSASGHPDRFSGSVEVAVEPSQGAIAAISGLMPTMFMTRVRL